MSVKMFLWTTMAGRTRSLVPVMLAAPHRSRRHSCSVVASMQPRWTPLEVKRMLKLLKEKGKWTSVLHLSARPKIYSVQGMSVFLKDYVVHKKIPIPELLSAFDIMLVCSIPKYLTAYIDDASQCEELQKKKPATLMYFLQVALSRE